MERLCCAIEPNPGDELAETQEALAAAGYTEHTVFRPRSTVVGHDECVSDIDRVVERMAQDPVSAQWADAHAGVANPPLRPAIEVRRL